MLVPTPYQPSRTALRLRRLGIDTHQEPVVYMREDCEVCRSEGLDSLAQVQITHNGRTLMATLHHVTSDILARDEVALSDAAWQSLGAHDGDAVTVRHAPLLESFSYVRAKTFGKHLEEGAFRSIISDVAARRYADVHLASFITACADGRLDLDEIVGLTTAMIDVGERLDWGRSPVMDKHSIGGLAGNRTSPIVVSIATACGLTMPKTSSRAITSPAGTADTMETLTRVDLDLPTIRRVVEKEGGCIAWGGAVRLSPADDILIRVERILDLDSEGQLVASVLSKKAAAGATHLVLDLPVGPTAKVRSEAEAERLASHLLAVAKSVGIEARALMSDGTQPVGRGIGPALEARDVLAVLQNQASAPDNLRERAVRVAAAILELGGAAPAGAGAALAQTVIADGRAWRKFQAICEAQGGLRAPPSALYTHPVVSDRAGRVTAIDNRRISRVAKLAGAPDDKAAGVDMHVVLGQAVGKDEPLFTIHADSPGQIVYSLDYVKAWPDIVHVEPT
jgi:thymidine phosphorylase